MGSFRDAPQNSFSGRRKDEFLWRWEEGRGPRFLDMGGKCAGQDRLAPGERGFCLGRIGRIPYPPPLLFSRI